MTQDPRTAVLGLTHGSLGRLLAVLDSDGEEARVVGGAVRNALMGLPIAEVDIATTAVPEEVTRRCAAAGFRVVPTGIDHGTVTVIVHGTPFEVTTLREDVETYGRRAKVAFGRDWRRDAERRDFTINALSVTRDGRVFDYVDGLADIAARRVRFIGDAAQRITEDYLRILRFFRFHAFYGTGHPDAVGLHAAIEARAGLATLARERVRMELMKLLQAPHATPTLASMSEAGFLVAVLGGVPTLAHFEMTAKVEAAAGVAPDPVRRLGALGACVTEDADRLCQRLRLSNAEHARIHSIADGWWRIDPAAGDTAARALLYRLGVERFVDRVLIAWARADAGAADPAWLRLATLPQRWTPPAFPLRAADLIRRGVARGPLLGRALGAAESNWIARDFPADKAALDGIADEAAASVRAG
ncbi:MAG TPA: CCA tRNA nucleotidyltransferase [Xanthobacteraceae bacterium]|nr:CCA tRNA nucleotidyltransferase [Xanthobacteraceae bacterium]